MKKRILAVILSTVMTVTMFVGCGDSVETTGTVETDSAVEVMEDVMNESIEVEEIRDSYLETEEPVISTDEIVEQDIENQDIMSNDNQNTETSDESIEIVERRWMVLSIETESSSYSQTQEGYVEYDEFGRISKTNINFFTIYNNGGNSFTYEYEENGELKIDDRWYTFDEQGRVTTERTDVASWRYTYLDKPQELYSVAGNDKTVTKTYNCIELNESMNRYITRDYSGYRIEQFAIPLHHSDYEYEITADEYGNPIIIKRSKTNSRGEKIYYINYFTYVYCTLDEYFAAKESGDFGGLQISSYEGR